MGGDEDRRDVEAGATEAADRERAGRGRRLRQRGQILVIFSLSIFVFIGLCGVVVDVAWYWANNLRMQRAADAAALAGVVWLPGDVPKADNAAYAEATKNGYTTGVNGYTVTPVQDPTNARRLVVTINGPVPTFFAHLFGINSFQASRTGKADYVLPVPMGSPENYYGVFGTIRGATFTQPQTSTSSGPDNTGLVIPTTSPATSPANSWTPTSGNLVSAVTTNGNGYAATTTNNATQTWGGFDLTSGVGANQTMTSVDGIQVFLNDAYITATCNNSKFSVALSWDGGGSWTTPATQTGNLPTSTTSGDFTLGNAGNLTAWGGHTWLPADLATNKFQVQVTANKGCATGSTGLRLDQLRVQVNYTVSTTTTGNVTTNLGDVELKGPGTACVNGAADCYQPDGATLNPRGFWGTMNTEGAANVNGDAYQPYYDTNTSTVAPTCPAGNSRSCYDPATYYNYAVEMPPGSTGGYVYVFDPGFCATTVAKGTGDRWFSGSNGVSSWYELLDENNTPYNLTDDTLIASSDTTFMNMTGTDTSMGGPSTGSGRVECEQKDTQYGDGRDYHDSWYLLNPSNPLTGGAGGTTYRLHTTGTDPRSGGNPASQRNTDGEQSFALYASASGGSPKIYGLGAMQMFTPLCAGGFQNCPVSSTTTSSSFYLAQIDSVHAGKTMEIQLWDPGDTCSNPGSNCLAANLQILQPTAGGWTAASMDYSAQTGTTNNGKNNACNTNTGSGVSSIQTATSSSSLGLFNGCWLTIDITIPVNYQAYQSGWWKIQYNMNGTGASNDVTTWTVSIRGNPVHLVVP